MDKLLTMSKKELTRLEGTNPTGSHETAGRKVNSASFLTIMRSLVAYGSR
jgi:hypothetical protein